MRFVEMLEKGQIIVIQCNRTAARKTYDYKFIGSDGNGVWDFTPMIAGATSYPNNSYHTVQRLCIRSLDFADVITRTLQTLRSEGIFTKEFRDNDLYSLYSYARTKVRVFYM